LMLHSAGFPTSTITFPSRLRILHMALMPNARGLPFETQLPPLVEFALCNITRGELPVIDSLLRLLQPTLHILKVKFSSFISKYFVISYEATEIDNSDL
jgi:hypothetical protein